MRKLKLPGRTVSQPRLEETDIRIINDQGIDGIREHAEKIVERKLREQPENDGSQTPYRGNPIYKAMHACNVSSRKELSKAHRIPAGKELTDQQIESIVNLLTRWIAREYNFYMQEKKAQRSLKEY